MPSIFTYLNYREYLRDAFAQKKQGLASYSYRLFSAEGRIQIAQFF